MAEVSNLPHRHHPPLQQRQTRGPIPDPTTGDHEEQQQQEEFHQPNSFGIDLNSFPLSNGTNHSFFTPVDYDNTFDFDLNLEPPYSGSDYEDSLADPNCFLYGGEEGDDDDQMNYVTDLFESREAHLPEQPIWELYSGLSEDPELEFGVGPRLMSVGAPSLDGLRAVGMDSESDSEAFEVNSGFINDDDIYDIFGVNNFQISENEMEEFEWEEVNEIIQFDERENLNSVIDRIEEISVTSDFSTSEGENPLLGEEGRLEERNIEWEVLLEMNNLERSFEFENPEESYTVTQVHHIGLSDDYILAVEYDTVFSQLVENENALSGSPPAAKFVVDNLPLVELTKEDVGENSDAIVCTVCKDEVLIGETAARMPCCHLYHVECIVPWLTIRNTCPVCRYELPTDDVDYEQRRSRRGGSGIAASSVDDL